MTPNQHKQLLFVGVVAALLVIFLALPRQVAQGLFLLLVGCSALVVVWYGIVRQWRGQPSLQHLWQYLQAHRALVARSLAGLAILCMLRQAEVFYRGEFKSLWEACYWMVLGGLAWWGSVWVRPPDVQSYSSQAISLHGLRWRWLVAALTCFWIAGETNAQALGGIIPSISHHWQWLLFVGGIACLVRWNGQDPQPSSLPVIKLPRWETVFIFALTLLGLGVRLYHLESSIRVMVDEMLFAAGSTKFWYTPDVPLFDFIAATAPYAQLYTYGVAWGVELFGRSFFGLRLFSVILGALTVPVVYFLARYWFDRTVASVAAILMATFPVHVHFSRLALNQVGDPLFGTMALAFLARGLRYHRRRDYILAGIALGMTQYFYEGGRIVFPALLLVGLVLGSLFWQPRLGWRASLLLLIAAVLVALPWYYKLMNMESEMGLIPRYNTAGATNDRLASLSDPAEREIYLHQHLQRAFGVYVTYPDVTFYYMGEQPMLLVYLIPPFLIGCCWLLWRWRSPEVLLLLWLVGVALGNSLVRESDWYTRFLNTAPALMLITAVGLCYGIRQMRLGRWENWVILGTVMLMGSGQTYYYFEQHLPTFNLQTRATPDPTDAILRAVDLPPRAILHLIGEYDEGYYKGMLAFFADGRTLRVLPKRDLTPLYLKRLERRYDHAFFIQVGDWQNLRLLATYFVLEPAQYTVNPDVPRDKSYVLYYARAEENRLR